MLIDLNMQGKEALVVGGGRVAEFKTLKLLEAGAKVTVVSKRFTPKLKTLAKKNRVKLIVHDFHVQPRITERLNITPHIAIVATNQPALNRCIAEGLRTAGLFISAVDVPEINDFNMPALARFGDVEVAVSTGGKSPLMARVIKEKLQRLEIIAEEEVLQVKLQEYARHLAKLHVPIQTLRERILREIARNTRVRSLLRSGQLDEAKALVKQIIESKTASKPSDY